MPILSSLFLLEEEVRGSGPDLTRYFLVCTGLLLLILGVAWAFRRFLAGTLRSRASKRSLQVLDALPLGGKQRLLVVRCYDRSFLLGVGEKEVRSIAELDAGEVPPPVLAVEPEPRRGAFTDALDRAVDREGPVVPARQRDDRAPREPEPAVQNRDMPGAEPSEPEAPWPSGEGVLA